MNPGDWPNVPRARRAAPIPTQTIASVRLNAAATLCRNPPLRASLLMSPYYVYQASVIVPQRHGRTSATSRLLRGTVLTRSHRREGQNMPGHRAEARARFWRHAGSEIGCGSPIAWNEEALDRPARPVRGVGGVAMPCRPVEHDQRTSNSACQHLFIVVGPPIRHRVLRHFGTMMRAWYKAGRAIVRSKLVHHQDETDKWPVGGFATHINVQILSRLMWPQRPRQQRAELERPANHTLAGFEKRWKDIEVVEHRATVHQIADARSGAADPDVVAGRRRHHGVVRVDQGRHPSWRHRASNHDEAPLLQL